MEYNERNSPISKVKNNPGRIDMPFNKSVNLLYTKMIMYWILGSSLYFSACLEKVIGGINEMGAVNINSKLLTQLRFADHIVLIAETPYQLQVMLTELKR